MLVTGHGLPLLRSRMGAINAAKEGAYAGSKVSRFSSFQTLGRIIRPIGRIAGVDRCDVGRHQTHTAFNRILRYSSATMAGLGNCFGCWCGKRAGRETCCIRKQGHSVRVGRNRGGAQSEDGNGDENNLFHAMLTPQSRLGSLHCVQNLPRLSLRCDRYRLLHLQQNFVPAMSMFC